LLITLELIAIVKESALSLLGRLTLTLPLVRSLGLTSLFLPEILPELKVYSGLESVSVVALELTAVVSESRVVFYISKALVVFAETDSEI